MGHNNRARRAARQRKQQRAGHGRPAEDRSSAPPDAVELARQVILQARLQHYRGLPLAQCVQPLLALPATTVDRAVDVLLGDLLRRKFAGGWTPLDLAEVSRRRIQEAGTSYLLDAVAAVTDEYPAPLVDPRWRAQLELCDGRTWWDRRRSQLSQWGERDGRSQAEALVVIIELLGMLEHLPCLEQVLTPPGAPVRSGPRQTIDPAQEKVLAKVRSLLAKAESTDFDEEAEALSAKAQELMSRYALDRALLDHVRGVRQHATLVRIWLDAPYVTAKSMLVDAVAHANRCRAILSRDLGSVTVVGDELDLRVVELLTTSLLLQGSRAMLATGSQSTRSGVSRTRSYRQSFLVAYAGRIGERLRAANETSTSDTDASRLLPVLSARSRAVDELIEQQFPDLVSKRVSVSNAAGWGAGRAAADLARLDVNQALERTG